MPLIRFREIAANFTCIQSLRSERNTQLKSLRLDIFCRGSNCLLQWKLQKVVLTYHAWYPAFPLCPYSECLLLGHSHILWDHTSFHSKTCNIPLHHEWLLLYCLSFSCRPLVEKKRIICFTKVTFFLQFPAYQDWNSKCQMCSVLLPGAVINKL